MRLVRERWKDGGLQEQKLGGVAKAPAAGADRQELVREETNRCVLVKVGRERKLSLAIYR